MKWVTERNDEMNVAPRRQYATDFAHDLCRIANMFEHRIALHTLKNLRRERQVFCVGSDIDSRHRKQIKIDIALDDTASPADVEIPAT